MSNYLKRKKVILFLAPICLALALAVSGCGEGESKTQLAGAEPAKEAAQISQQAIDAMAPPTVDGILSTLIRDPMPTLLAQILADVCYPESGEIHGEYACELGGEIIFDVNCLRIDDGDLCTHRIWDEASFNSCMAGDFIFAGACKIIDGLIKDPGCRDVPVSTRTNLACTDLIATQRNTGRTVQIIEAVFEVFENGQVNLIDAETIAGNLKCEIPTDNSELAWTKTILCEDLDCEFDWACEVDSY